MKAEKIILLSELNEMMDREIQSLKRINPMHCCLDGLLYASGYVTTCTEEHKEIQQLIEIGRMFVELSENEQVIMNPRGSKKLKELYDIWNKKSEVGK